MKSFLKIIILLVLALIVGGLVALATTDIAKPTAKVEKVIPDDRFSR